MKMTRIFLGASASVLAIAGAFASKANNKLVTITGYTVGCVNNVQTSCLNSGSFVCHTSFGTTLYTKISSGCVNKILTSTNQ